MNYKKTQIGFFSLGVLGLVLFVTGGIYFAAEPAGTELIVLRAALLLLILIMILFSTLTVEVNRNEVIWYFGPGLWKYKINIRDIDAVVKTRSHPFEGVGIRWNPWRGWLYNVSGLWAVKVIRKNGKSTRIGTSDPDGLREAIKEQMRVYR